MQERDVAYFARLSRELMQQGAEEPTLQTVVARAVEVVPGCVYAGVSLRRRRNRVATVAATDEIVEGCDELQYELSEGPCLSAIWDGDAYVSNDLHRDQRWPTWGPRVAEQGIRSIIALRIADDSEAIGALNLYAARADAYDDHAFDIATAFGYHAANALVSAKLVDGLESSLRSRHTIGLAQGILMAKYGLSVDQSFTVLQRYSSHENIRLRDLAAQIVDSGVLPGESGFPEAVD